MSEKITRDDGTEVEVYTAEEVQAKTAEAVAAKEAEFTPIKTKLEADLNEVKTALNERTGEFKQFRKLSDDAVAKLNVAERTIYENGVALEEERKKRLESETNARKAQVESVLKAKAGTNDKLLGKMKEMWEVIGIDAITPEQMEQKTMMILGAIGTTQPDLVATVAGFTGSFLPPKPEGQGDTKSFSETEQGKAAAKELGLEIPKQQ